MINLQRIVFRIVLALFCVFFLEASYFSYIITLKNSDVQSDAILIFTGSEKRIEAGYELANQGLAPRIVLSSSTDMFRRYCDRQYAMKGSVTHIPEDQAANTFENALFTARIIKAHQFKDVILVTSDYHMPRSLALLRLLLGGDVRIHVHQVHGAAGVAAINITLLKLVYNEMVEFWGSLFEYATYRVKGNPAEKPVQKCTLSHYLRSLVLMDVKRLW